MIWQSCHTEYVEALKSGILIFVTNIESIFLL